MTDKEYFTREEFVNMVEAYNKAEKERQELKAENDRLKECNEELTSDNLNTIQEMDNERRRVEQLKAESERLKQTLQEIKEIARNEVETRILFSDEKSFCDFNDILTKINEVIGAE